MESARYWVGSDENSEASEYKEMREKQEEGQDVRATEVVYVFPWSQ